MPHQESDEREKQRSLFFYGIFVKHSVLTNTDKLEMAHRASSIIEVVEYFRNASKKRIGSRSMDPLTTLTMISYS